MMLYQSVFTGLVESLESILYQAIVSYERMSKDAKDENDNLSCLEILFRTFPHNYPVYKSTIASLKDLSKTNINNVLIFITDIVNDLMDQNVSALFASLPKSLPVYNSNSKFHRILYFYFSLFFVTDLAHDIMLLLPESYPISNLMVSIEKICYHDPFNYRIHEYITQRWAEIVSLISEFDFKPIDRLFDLQVKAGRMENAFGFIRYARIDCLEDFGEAFASKLEVIIDYDILTPKILQCIYFLLYTLPEHPVIGRIYDVLIEALNNEKLKPYAIRPIAALKGRYTEFASGIIEFIETHVIPYASHPLYAEYALSAIHTAFCAPSITPQWMFFSLGCHPKSPQKLMLNWPAYIDIKKIAELFMKYFFDHCDFHTCHIEVYLLLAHIANLDFEFFLHDVVPPFLAISALDFRFLTLLNVVPIINSPYFKKVMFTGESKVRETFRTTHHRNTSMNQLTIFNNSLAQIDSDEINAVSDDASSTSSNHDHSSPLISEGKVSYSDSSNEDLANLGNFQEMLHVFNEKMRERSLVAIDEMEHMNILTDPCVTFRENDKALQSISEEYTQKVSAILEAWNVETIFQRPVLFIESDDYDKLNVFYLYTECVPYFLHDDDYMSEKVIMTIIELFMNRNALLSISTYNIITNNIVSQPRFNLEFIKVLLKILFTPLSLEGHHNCMSCLLIAFMKIKKHEITPELFDQIELACLICWTCKRSCTRMIALSILTRINDFKKDECIFTHLKKYKTRIEENVRTTMINRIVQEKPTVVSIPTESISVKLAVGCNFYDVWLIYLKEIIETMVECNHPLVPRIREVFKNLLVKNNIGMYIAYLNTFVYKGDEATLTNVFETLYNLNQSGHPKKTLKILTYLNHTLLQSSLDLLSLVDPSLIETTAETLVYILKLPDITKEEIDKSMTEIISFISLLQNYFIQIQINAPRIIKWTDEMKEKAERYSLLITHYCIILMICFGHLVQLDIWLPAARELTARFLMNWSRCPLVNIQQYAMRSFGILAKNGPLFSDIPIFDDDFIMMLYEMEKINIHIIRYLIHYHFDNLIEYYIDGCFTQQRYLANSFFESISSEMIPENADKIYVVSGELMMLGLVYKYCGHFRADFFFENFLNVMARKIRHMAAIKEKLKENSPFIVIPKYFASLTEAVFRLAFKLFKRKIHIHVKDIVEPLKPWIRNLRLLPKQQTCSPEISQNFNYFTPYEFLVNLMESTEIVEDDQFLTINSLWVELMKAPDHKDLIPLFISNWSNQTTSQKLIGNLLLADPESIVGRISLRCTFGYYYHVTEFINSDFQKEFWIIPLLANGFKKYSNKLGQFFINCLHFAFLFRDDGALDLFSTFCQLLSIENPPGSLSITLIRKMVKQFANESNADQWANEALKWVIGCKSIKLATLSFIIYNQLARPADPNLPALIIKTVIYHLNTSDTQSLNNLIGESFIYLLSVFNTNEMLVMSYYFCFLDCRCFIEASMTNSTQLVLKILSCRTTSKQSWDMIIPIVRPMIRKLEESESVQKLFELFIKTSHNLELMMIVAPLKANNPILFPSSKNITELFATVNETILCKALPHYALLATTGSRNLINSIFDIAATIVENVVNENNRVSLAKLYRIALHRMSRCPKAMRFLNVLIEREPIVATMNAFDIYEWDRSIDDVKRSLSRISIKTDFPTVMITECKNYLHCTHLLSTETPVKILPFAAQCDMIEGMVRVKLAPKLVKVMSKQKMTTQSTSVMYSSLQYRSAIFGQQNNETFEGLFNPLLVPSNIKSEDVLFRESETLDLTFSSNDFLTAPTY